MNSNFTPTGYRILSPKEKALRVRELCKDKSIRGSKQAVKAFHFGKQVLDTSDENFRFDPDWSTKDLKRLNDSGYDPGIVGYNYNLLENFKSPNSQDRQNQRPKRIIYLDKRTKKKVQQIQNKYSYWINENGKDVKVKPDLTLAVNERNIYLSELQCCLHHLNYHVKLGTGRLRHSEECLALLFEILYTEQYWNSIDWYWIYDHMIRRCYSNNFEGNWKDIFLLLQASSNKHICHKALTRFKLKHKKFRRKKDNKFSKAAFNDFRKRGKAARTKVKFVIGLSEPVKHKQFKRGFQHGNSGNNPSKTKEEKSSLLYSSSRWTRDLRLCPPSEKESIMNYLYNNKRPVKELEYSTEGRYYSKTDTIITFTEESKFPKLSLKPRNNFLEEERKRIKSLEKSYKKNYEIRNKEYIESTAPGEVIRYKLDPQDLELKLQEVKRRLKYRPDSEVVLRHLELEKYR